MLLRLFTRLGDHGAIWLAIGAAAGTLDEPRRAQWHAGARRVAIAYGINQAIKVIVRRQRPADKRAHTRTNLSFPSAHATTSFCGARMYGRLGVNLYPLAAALAASRLILRVHHPSDVLAGAVLGTAIAR